MTCAWALSSAWSYVDGDGDGDGDVVLTATATWSVAGDAPSWRLPTHAKLPADIVAVAVKDHASVKEDVDVKDHVDVHA